MANLGLVYRRQGRSRQSDDVLQVALTKLRPTSRDYEAVEVKLARLAEAPGRAWPRVLRRDP